jgi:hypothetical protein
MKKLLALLLLILLSMHLLSVAVLVGFDAYVLATYPHDAAWATADLHRDKILGFTVYIPASVAMWDYWLIAIAVFCFVAWLVLGNLYAKRHPKRQ